MVPYLFLFYIDKIGAKILRAELHFEKQASLLLLCRERVQVCNSFASYLDSLVGLLQIGCTHYERAFLLVEKYTFDRSYMLVEFKIIDSGKKINKEILLRLFKMHEPIEVSDYQNFTAGSGIALRLCALTVQQVMGVYLCACVCVCARACVFVYLRVFVCVRMCGEK